jgi:hypothetical protein
MAAVAEQTFVEHRGRIYLIPPQPFVVVPVRADTLPRRYYFVDGVRLAFLDEKP